jgi:protein-S-isoprenylcysteine O-methyltransferase Ste14
MTPGPVPNGQGRPSGGVIIIASRLATLVLIGTIVVLYLRHWLIGERPLSFGLQIVAVVLMLWARLTFGMRSFHAAANPTEGGLVTTGPYRFVRHPIYSAILLFVWVGVLSHPALWPILLGALASAAIAVRIRAEETMVTERYPAYLEYAKRTRRVIPFLL